MVKNSATPLPLREGQFTTTAWVESNLNDTKMGYFSSIEFYNLTDTPLCVQDRLGVPQVIPSDPKMRKNINDPTQRTFKPMPAAVRGYGLFVVYSFSYLREELNDLIERYSYYAGSSILYRKVVNALRASLNDEAGWTQLRTISVTVSLREGDLEGRDLFYIQELGVVISTSINMDLCQNPESLAELQRFRCNNVVCDINVEDDPAYVSIKAHSNKKANQFDKLYIQLLGQVQEIPMIYNSTGDFNGIEVCYKRSVDIGGEDTQPQFRRYTYEEAFKTLGVCSNVYDAKNTDLRNKQEYERKHLELQNQLKDQEVELKRLTNDLAGRKLEQDRLALDYKEREDKRKQEYDTQLAEYKLLEDQRRREYEERILLLKNQQLDKDIQLKEMTEEYNRLRMAKEMKVAEYKNSVDVMKSTMGLFGNVLGFMLQVLKSIPAK